jgi:CRISPR-associated protein Csb2
MLTLELELLTGMYRASVVDGSGAEWPPNPDRVFSALVQAWADGGRRDEERRALEWLEQQQYPVIEASAPADAPERDAAIVYVPPNDVSGADPTALPDARSRRERRFRARAPLAACVRFQWDIDVSPATLASLSALVHRLSSVGHSSSLTRGQFRTDHVALDERQVWRVDPDGEHPLRSLYRGRFDDLEAWFAVGRRPGSPVTVRYRAPPESERIPVEHGSRNRDRMRRRSATSHATSNSNIEESVFGSPSNWFVFAHREGAAPDLLAFAHVAARARDALMQLAAQPAPEILTGHGPDGGPSLVPHAAIVPLANVGWEHANGDLVGFAVVLPRRVEVSDRAAALGAIARFAGLGERTRTWGVAELRLGRAGVWRLERDASPIRSSLKPERWCTSAKAWATATPAMLDRYAKDSDPAEEAAIVAASCVAIGLPEPVVIEIHKHATFRGAPSTYPDRGVRHRARWSFPEGSRLSDRVRRHVVLEFNEPVRGPVFLGAGRYHGFGMCLPLDGAASL